MRIAFDTQVITATIGHFILKSNSFSYERFCTRTRFQTEAQGNLEMAYSIAFLKHPNNTAHEQDLSKAQSSDRISCITWP